MKNILSFAHTYSSSSSANAAVSPVNCLLISFGADGLS
jgi:hypothetical protein